MFVSHLWKFRFVSALMVALGGTSLTVLTAPAMAVTAEGDVDLTVTGTVIGSTSDTIRLRNPDGSQVTLSGRNVPGYAYRAGDSMSTTVRFATHGRAGHSMLDNAACGGKFSLGLASNGGGSGCKLAVVAITGPFGQAQLSGQGDGYASSISGLNVALNDGQWDLSAPNGSYNFRYAGVVASVLGSWTDKLPGSKHRPCRHNRNCGTSSSSGGSSSGGSSGGAVDVPEPSMLALFGLGAAVLMLRRRRRTAP